MVTRLKRLTQGEIQKAVAQVVQLFHPQRVILFGSYAEGGATEESDLDLLVITSRESGPKGRHLLEREILKDSLVPVQIITMTAEEFEETKDVIGGIAYPANKYGIVLYEKP